MGYSFSPLFLCATIIHGAALARNAGRRACGKVPSPSAFDVLGAVVGRRRDLHDLEIVGIFDVLLRDLALVGDAIALADHHLAQPLELGTKPAAHHEDQMKAGVVGVARGAAARLELLDGAADGAADTALGRFREAEIPVFQKRPQALARPMGTLEARQDYPWDD